MQITRNVTVTIENREFVRLLVDVLFTKSREKAGKEKAMYFVLGRLVDCSDVEAVKQANKKAAHYGVPHIKVDEFRKWLPKILSTAFAEFLKDERE